MEQVTGGDVDQSWFDRGKTKEEQEAYVRGNFEIEKSMGLSFQYAYELECTKAIKYKGNLLTNMDIKNIGLSVYNPK